MGCCSSQLISALGPRKKIHRIVQHLYLQYSEKICQLNTRMHMYVKCEIYMSYVQNMVHGEGTSLSRAVAAPWINLPQGIVLGIVLGWAPIGVAVMATPRPSQYLIVQYSYVNLSINLDATEPSKTCSDHRIIFSRDLVAGCGSFMALDAVRS